MIKSIRMRKKKVRHEQNGQIAIFNFARRLMTTSKCSHFMAFHVPNGFKLTKYEAYISKELGVMPGVTDMIVLFNGGRSVFLELKYKPEPVTKVLEGKRITASKKRHTIGRQSKEQKLFEERVKKLGFDYEIISFSSQKDATNKFREFLEKNKVDCNIKK